MKTGDINHAYKKQAVLDMKNGDYYAFKHIYTSYGRRVFTMAYSYLKSREDTEELVQEVFLKLWRYRNNIDADRPLEAYLFRIAKNEIFSFIRKRKPPFSSLEVLQIDPQDGSQPDMIYSANSNREVVTKIIEELSEKTRQVFLLRRVEDLSCSEIAEKMAISVKTVENHMTRAQNFLRTRLREEEILLWIIICLSAGQ